MKNKIIIYTRVSTDEQAQGYSLDAQEEKLRKFCYDKGYEIIKHFQDDTSAKTLDRPSLNSLRAFAKSNKSQIDLVLVVKWDRLSRDIANSYQIIKEFKELGIIINAVDQWNDESSPENVVLQAINLAIPQAENERRALNTISGMRQKMKQGGWCGTPPKGYNAPKYSIDNVSLIVMRVLSG